MLTPTILARSWQHGETSIGVKEQIKTDMPLRLFENLCFGSLARSIIECFAKLTLVSGG
jgi:hypothetical protein